MEYIYHYYSPLGGITIASDGKALTGLWFDGQKYFGSSLRETGAVNETGAAIKTGAANDTGMANDTGAVTKTGRANDTGAARPADDCSPGYEGILSVFEQTVRWLDEYFEGRDPGFTPPLNIESDKNKAATPFRNRVWTELLRVPYGETVTYKELAERIAGMTTADTAGSVKVSARAVGGAVGHNPISLIIPCHRVVGADGRLTGYAGGVDKKKALLEMEGAALPGVK